MKSRIQILLPIIFIGLMLSCTNGTKEKLEEKETSEWTSLFNGRDLTGWDTFLSYQPDTGDTSIIGVNKDPEGIFSVVNSTIRISGKIWGALTSVDEFDNFHLRFQFKWGGKKWPPRDQKKRDSGILYYCVGPHGAQSDHWMRSHESQVQEGDCGDYHSLDGALIDIEATEVKLDDEVNLKYTPGTKTMVGVHQRVLKSETNEKPNTEWNTMEVIAKKNGDITHIVNGKVVFKASNSRQTVNQQEVPLLKGKIQFQSEGAEVFYRNIEIKQTDLP